VSGFFRPFVNVVSPGGNKFRSMLFKEVTDRLMNASFDGSNGNPVSFSSVRLRPDWLNYEDYERLCHSGLNCLTKEVVNLYPELPLFLGQFVYHS
jgi:hypothetical protein